MRTLGDIWYDNISCTFPIVFIVITVSVAFSYCYAECRYVDCHYAECRYAKFCGAVATVEEVKRNG